MPANALREAFLKFFDRRGHLVCASTPIVPQGDPTLLFTSAGMVPFKAYFLGIKSGISRAASCQRCLRTTDIDRIGTTLRHLTFFEMLGNFSFGDYFKADAIHWAWEFLIREMKLDPKRLHPTVFRDDSEAMDLWKKESPPNAPARLDEDTNFWNMGPTGPCGPCSEIYYDLGEELSCGKPGCEPGCDCDRYIELWNLVFTQFDRQEDGSLKPLPQKNIDTGMGLERLALAAEGKRSPFETALLSPIMAAAREVLRASPQSDPEARTALRIIADHVRSAAVLAAEGIIPSNVERGYVLRRLIRRAVRYGRLLDRREPFLRHLVAPVLEVLGKPYPDIAKSQDQILQTLKAEEERFLITLGKGERELDEILAKKPKALSGEIAFKLYDTFGFPFELTKEICRDRGVPVDEAAFAAAQERATAIARSGWQGSGEQANVQYEKLSAANPGLASQFTGYQNLQIETRIACVIPYRPQDPLPHDAPAGIPQLYPGDEGEVILQRTTFYPEGGGQVGDQGSLLDDLGNKVAEVHDTRRPLPHLITHRVTALRLLQPGMKVKASVDPQHRQLSAYHHTATHLLNEALRRVLGPNVRQAGSWVAPDRLRFDFTFPRPMTEEELKAVESQVNGVIEADMPVEPQERARTEIGALKAVTLLGEDYGETPRFVLIAPKGWRAPMDRFSLELCGGTHVENTGQIRRFKIVRESSVAAGIRRIEAVAGPALEEYRRSLENKLRQELEDSLARYLQVVAQIMEITRKPIRAIPQRVPDPATAPIPDIQRALSALRELEKMLRNELSTLKKQALTHQAQMGKVLLEVGDVRLCIQKFSQAETATLRSIADEAKREIGTGVVLVGSSDEKKLSFIVSVTQDLVGKGLHAGRIAQTVAGLTGGKAGGRPDFAQGGGPDYDWEKIVATVSESIRSRA
ncbi:MAG: alanine--tRNA ligase [Elusimicrobia bacterium]|nr:alanine--tRNA ligase [Elusimicrobiota bacterium]